MRFLPRALVAGGIGFAVSCLAACGGGPGLLSGNQAGSLQSNLDQMSGAVSSRNCDKAASHARAMGSDVVNLPDTVNPTLRTDLARGVSTASRLALQDCQRPTTTSTATTSATTTTAPTTTTTPTTTTATTPTTTPTTPTTTPTTPTTTPTTPTTTPTTTSPSGGGGLGGGGGSPPPGAGGSHG